MSESKSFWSAFLDFFTRLFGGSGTEPTMPPVDSGILTPLQPRVFVIVYDPVVDTTTGKRLIETMGWSEPDTLIAGYIADIDECSGGLVKFKVAQKIVADEIPIKIDGFRYTPQKYLQVAQTNTGAHDPDAVDYLAILAQHNILARVAAGEFDEVWLFGGPYFGFWESAMAGAGAFFSNGGPINGTSACPRRFHVMGFNYQRGIGEMLEDIGHRAESILSRVWQSEEFLSYTYNRERQPKTVSNPTPNLYERFLYFDQIAPGKSNVGNVHYAPNSQGDYEWGVPTPVPSCADDWLEFPNLPDPPNFRTMTAQDWGGGDIRKHHKWWLERLPKAAGTTNGIANNWWKYVIDVNDPLFENRR
jgi:hypothetical protein